MKKQLLAVILFGFAFAAQDAHAYAHAHASHHRNHQHYHSIVDGTNLNVGSTIALVYDEQNRFHYITKILK